VEDAERLDLHGREIAGGQLERWTFLGDGHGSWSSVGFVSVRVTTASDAVTQQVGWQVRA
jgi:hypothetical protein